MKHEGMNRKRIGTLLLAGALAVATAVPVFAVTKSSIGDNTTIDVYVSSEEPVYSVNVTWGSMEFCYKYGTGWDYSNATFNQIKVENHSLAPVGMTLKFKGQSGYSGKFNSEQDGSGSNYEVLYMNSLESNLSQNIPTGSVYLVLNAVRPTNTERQKAGQITLSLVDVVGTSIDEFENQYGSGSIGHVTRTLGLMPFDKNNLEA